MPEERTESSLNEGCHLADEEEIVWLEDPATLPYVRQGVLDAVTRRRPIAHPYGDNPAGKAGKPGCARTVGYAVLKSSAQRNDTPHCYGGFERRVFWLKEYDRVNNAQFPKGHPNHRAYETTTPQEAVDPLTIAPGKRGEVTERAWGRPFRKGDWWPSARIQPAAGNDGKEGGSDSAPPLERT